MTVEQVLHSAVSALDLPPKIQIAAALQQRQLMLFPRALGEALQSVIENARQAAGAGAVSLAAEWQDGVLIIRVIDTGPGMSAATLARATDPFFTSKPVGEGMGLGLFLARALVERMGGQLQIESAPDAGCTVSLTFEALTDG